MISGDVLALIGVGISSLVALYLGVKKSGSDNRTASAAEVTAMSARVKQMWDRQDQQDTRISEQQDKITQQGEQLAEQAAALRDAHKELTELRDLTEAQRVELVDLQRTNEHLRRLHLLWKEYAYKLQRVLRAEKIRVPMQPPDDDVPPAMEDYG